MEEKTYLDQLIEFAWVFGPKILMALLLFFGGWWLIKRLTIGFDIFLRSRKVDESLRPFFTSLTDIGLKVMLVFMVASTVGIETTSFLAVFSAIAFSVGLALQGSLGNFASGVLILLFKPYRVGDLLTVDNKIGYVTEIQIFNTILATSNNKKIIIPNRRMTEVAIENIEMGKPVQVEVALLLDGDNDLGTVRAAVNSAARRCPWLVAEREPEVVITGLSRDDMKAEVSWWTLGEHYTKTADFMHEALKVEFAGMGVKIAKERRKENV